MGLTKDVLSLQQFMRRKEVLNLYRDFFKLIRCAPLNERKSLQQWIREDFKNSKHLTDDIDIKLQLSRGRLALREMAAAVNLPK
ncbi:LYR motif-containing protein 2 [Hydra vulgaris]|uniref:LYR motif-containing protein 2 n=1 Tax=Hydra vulgaris TaxID=6087 RepID=A0ABM4BDG3_HYDVU